MATPEHTRSPNVWLHHYHHHHLVCAANPTMVPYLVIACCVLVCWACGVQAAFQIKINKRVLVTLAAPWQHPPPPSTHCLGLPLLTAH